MCNQGDLCGWLHLDMKLSANEETLHYEAVTRRSSGFIMHNVTAHGGTDLGARASKVHHLHAGVRRCRGGGVLRTYLGRNIKTQDRVWSKSTGTRVRSKTTRSTSKLNKFNEKVCIRKIT